MPILWTGWCIFKTICQVCPHYKTEIKVCKTNNCDENSNQVWQLFGESHVQRQADGLECPLPNPTNSPSLFLMFIKSIEKDHTMQVGSKCFTQICVRVIHPLDLPTLILYFSDKICLSKVYFPPANFGVMEHVLIHLINNLELCGPVGGR